MSRVVRFHQHGGPEQLRIEELDVGAPGDGEVRIRVEAIGLNRSEAMFRAGTYLQAPKLPSLIGYEGVGIVEALGPAVQGFSPGDRVCVMPTYRLGEYGCMGSRPSCRRAASSRRRPGSPWSKRRRSGCSTSRRSRSMKLRTRRSATDLIRAASSSVGLAAIQLANWAGAVPIATTRTGAKTAALKEQGAKHVIATEESDLVAEVRRITGGKGRPHRVRSGGRARSRSSRAGGCGGRESSSSTAG